MATCRAGRCDLITVILLSIVCGIAANELCEFGPWSARKLVRWSAFRRYANPERAEIRAEELTALINDRPGNLFKLLTAVSFAGAAVLLSARRAVTRESNPSADSTSALTAVSHDEVLGQVSWYLDGQVSEKDCVLIRQHLDECGSCLREYGLREAVKRHLGCGEVPAALRNKVLMRIKQVQAEIQSQVELQEGPFSSPEA
jgi:mycothiol system anti-sigma-R factor